MKALKIWISILIFIGCFLKMAYGYGQELILHPYYEHELTDYVNWFHRHMKPQYAKNARKIIPPTVKYAQKHGVDPLLLGCLFSFESSWRNFEGIRGELGPGNVMPGKWIKQLGLELKTLDGQIEAAAVILAKSFEDCGGNLQRAITYYACGKCVSQSPVTKRKMRYRVEYYKRTVKKFRDRFLKIQKGKQK